MTLEQQIAVDAAIVAAIPSLQRNALEHQFEQMMADIDHRHEDRKDEKP